MSYFPMFIELKDMRCLVVGGGAVALRKAEALSEFGAKLTVIAPAVLPELRARLGAACQEREFQIEDLLDQELVVAATDDAALNHRIGVCCKEAGIPVNAVDQIEDCSFLFPAYRKEGEVVAAFVSGGQSPVVSQYLKAQIGEALTPLLGELAAFLGSLRETLRKTVATEQERKRIYQKLLAAGLEKGAPLSEEEAWQIVNGEADGR